tara:strand:+ start:323 stop:1267 length:945 start_codon:yes stop_codon:yes gene_type:complete
MKKLTILFNLFMYSSITLFADTNTSGKVFYNYSINLDEERNNAFNMKRAYLTFANDVSETVSYKVTYDMGGNEGGSVHTAFLKVAMVKWNNSLGDVSIGMQGLNMFKIMENTWGHRFVQKMPMDTYGFSSSADLGIGLTRGFGAILTSVLVTNGGGYKNAESDSHKKFSFHAVFGEPRLNKNDGFNAGTSFSVEPHDLDSTTTANTNVMGIFAGYGRPGFRGGLEFDTKQQNDITSQIICVYGTYKISNKLSLLARLDQVEGNTSVKEDGIQAIIAGVHYGLEKGLTVAPTFRMTTLEGGETENAIVVNFQFQF